MLPMKRPIRRAGALLALCSLGIANACYAYVPVTGAPGAPGAESGPVELTGSSRAARTEVGAGDRVRVRLTAEGTRELARYLGPGVRTAEGTVSRAEGAGAFTMSVEFVQFASGVKMPWSGEGLVTIPSAMQEAVLRQSFDRGRTIVAAVALTGALVLTTVLALRQGGAGTDGTAGPPPPPP